MKFFAVVLFFLGSLVTNCLGQVANNNTKDTLEYSIPFSEFNISMVRLIANPEKYDGKLIQLQGFLNLSFEGTALYCHQEDFKHKLTLNAVRVDFSKNNLGKKLTQFGKRYVILVGKFEMTKDGIFTGIIKDISRLDFYL